MSHNRAHAPARCDRRPHGTGRRVFLILFVGGITAGIVSLFSGQTRRSVAHAPPPQSIARMHSGRLQDYVAENAVVSGALAGDKALAISRADHDPSRTVPVGATDVDPDANVRVSVATLDRPTESDKPRSVPALRVQRVRSTDPHPTRDRALTDAMTVARDRLVLELRLQEPSIDVIPTLDHIRANYVRTDSIVEVQPTAEQKAAWSGANLDPNRVWIELDVEVSDEQLRQLRSEERFGWAVWVLAAVLIAVAALHGFLHLDTWTKGYLTWGLALTAAAVGGAGIGTLFLVR